MRLIDADALLVELQKDEDYLDNEGATERADGVRDAIIEVHNTPTVERQTGKWIPHKSVFGGLGEPVYTCDQCGYNIGFHKENFCPNCGAKMTDEVAE